jgi:hypothetical protein
MRWVLMLYELLSGARNAGWAWLLPHRRNEENRLFEAQQGRSPRWQGGSAELRGIDQRIGCSGTLRGETGTIILTAARPTIPQLRYSSVTSLRRRDPGATLRQ